mgnify:CR=1 FL=1
MNLPDTDIHFDYFKDEGKNFFLSHFHSDHTAGLSRRWYKGTLYTSNITKKLLHHITKLKGKHVVGIEPGESIDIISNGNWYEITAFDANHCPGAYMYLINSEKGKSLFTGDFRYCDSFKDYASAFSGVHTLYLDDTYLNPKYKFPSQQESIDQIIKLAYKYPDKIIVFGTYNIGKEKIFLQVAKEFKTKIYTPPQKLRFYELMGMGEIFTKDKQETRFYVYNMTVMNYFYSKLDTDEYLIVIPRGWGYGKKNQEGKVYYIPYSEHSSYDEIMEFLNLTNAKHIYNLHGKPLTFQQELF